jgi:hypothetical protein
MQNLEVVFSDTNAAVRVYREYECELCQDTGLIEGRDDDGFPSGYFKKCQEHVEYDKYL